MASSVDSAREIWVFGPFRLDTVARVLFRDHQPVALTPKQVDTLLVLVREHGQVVERERLMAEVWPNTFVEDGGLTRNVSAIRRALDRDGTECIETVPKRGYRFVAPVTRERQAITAPPTAPLEPPPNPVAQPAAVAPPAPGARRLAVVLSLAVVMLLAGLWWQRSQPPAPDLEVTSLAVLPFRLLSSAESDRYLATGLADLLTTRLAGLATLAVRPASGTLHLAGSNPVAAGRSLGVEAVIDGTIRREGDRLRLTVQIIRVSTGAPLYAGSFDERGDDLLALEATLSDQVLGLVMPRILEGERAAMARRGTRSGAALDQYLLGRYALLSRQPEQIVQALSAFTRATQLDPDYALAHASLASAYALLGGYQFRAPVEVFPHAKAAALRALAIDGNLAEAYGALGEVAWSFEYDWAAADKAQLRALQLAPLEPQFHQWRAYYLAAMGRPDEAMAAAEQAARLAPNDYPAAITRAGVAYWSGRFDEAITWCRQAATMASHNPVPLLFQHFSLVALGRFAEAQSLFEQLKAMIPDEPIVVGMAAFYEFQAGRPGQSRRLLDELARRHRTGFVEAMYVAGGYARTGQLDAAFEWAQRAREDHSALLPMIAVDPVWRPHHGDKRFQELVRTLGLPPPRSEGGNHK